MESGGQPTQSQHRREGDEHAGHQCDGHGEDEDVAIDSDVLATRQIAWRQSHEQPKDCGGADQVEVDQLITLLLNPFSVRRKAFICSRIAQVLGTSVFDGRMPHRSVAATSGRPAAVRMDMPHEFLGDGICRP
jgi:hypothetical protein